MSGRIDVHCRRFLGAAAMTIAAAPLRLLGSANAESEVVPAIKPGTNTSFGPLKQIDAGLLNVGYAEVGPWRAHSVTLQNLLLCVREKLLTIRAICHDVAFFEHHEPLNEGMCVAFESRRLLLPTVRRGEMPTEMDRAGKASITTRAFERASLGFPRSRAL